MGYDYLVVGAGLFGATFARLMTQKGKKCLVIDKRNHIGGNCYTEKKENIHVHKYGAHIFHTSNKDVWEFIHQFADFNNYVNSPVANYNGNMYNMPFNMNTFSKMWNIKTPQEAKSIIAQQVRDAGIKNPKNLEEKAISLVGTDIYEKLVKGYTEKQWGKPCCELPESIINRLPVRFTYDNNYFNDRYQGIPIGGYTQIFENMLYGIDVQLNVDFFTQKEELSKKAKKIVFTGAIDAYYEYCYGELEYRSVRFEEELLDEENHQGVAVVNYTDRETPYTRVIEHKHFDFGTQDKTILSYEYSAQWEKGIEPYYPINNEKNQALYAQYKELADKEENVIFGGRLGQYKYADMDKIILDAMVLVTREKV